MCVLLNVDIRKGYVFLWEFLRSLFKGFLFKEVADVVKLERFGVG